jgi:CRISPR-associated endonuclease/helicase Cas3
MSPPGGSDFERYFDALHGHPPYDWQTRLAARAVEGNWPPSIDLPTGSGKTACIDIAVFALACQAGRPVAKRVAPRRIFFCVNRRVIVDEAHERAVRIAQALWHAERGQGPVSPVLRSVAAALRALAGADSDENAPPPLDVLELRGGIYRDNRWARSPTQPTVLCTTIDQLGSRLLFRGYGVSASAAPIQAALVAYDSLVLLDEAHISKPFLDTLDQVRGYLEPERWAQDAIGVRPMVVVPMTATPPPGVEAGAVLGLDERDRQNPGLDERLKAHKRATLVPVADVAKAIVERADRLARDGPAAVGIIVNRVATAREIHGLLRTKRPDAEHELVIGSMRPVDRDDQSGRLAPLVGARRPRSTTTTSFVCATQCLEVGADYDFDVLITECASLDALRQRFGRLNRGGRPIEARAVVMVRAKDIKPDDALDDEDPLDPIYGNALARTWNWLWGRAEQPATEAFNASGKGAKGGAKAASETRMIDFGIDPFKALVDEHADGQIPPTLLAPAAALKAPLMLPAHVDFWCQTAPRPVPDPDVALFLHGPQGGEPDLQVCWRADLLDDEYLGPAQWCDVVALVPPTAAECMSVPISRVRRWLVEEERTPDEGDLLELAASAGDEADDRRPTRRALRTTGVLWRGAAKSVLLETTDDLRPGDTLVLPEAAGGWNQLGHIPEPTPPAAGPGAGDLPSGERRTKDVAETAFEVARGRRVLRLHTWRRAWLPADEQQAFEALFDRLADADDPPNRDEFRQLMREAALALPHGDPLRDRIEWFAGEGRRLVREPYPDGRGLVLIARERIKTGLGRDMPALDDGDDEVSRLVRETAVSLADHTRDVRQTLGRSLALMAMGVPAEVYDLAAERHDWGKADERFQALLRGTDRSDAWLFRGAAPVLLAKSDGVPRTPHDRRAARLRAGLPGGFRHEMLSLQLAERTAMPEGPAAERELVLHLIAAHHGHARPFAPVVADDDPPEVEHEGVVLGATERKQNPPHRLDSGIADRFWSLTRLFGWWGLAYLEAMLRLADQQASADEDAGKIGTHETAVGAGRQT